MQRQDCIAHHLDTDPILLAGVNGALYMCENKHFNTSP